MYQLLALAQKHIINSYNIISDHLIAPPFCAHCKKFLKQRAIFCIDCYQLIDPVVSVKLAITKQQHMTVLAAGAYQEPLKTLIIAKSWSDIIASRQLGQLAWELSYFKHIPCDYLVPIPLHWLRKAKRGYNQAEEIAQVLAQYKQCDVAHLIGRSKHTPFQSSLAFDKRLDNVKNVFTLTTHNPEQYYNKHIVLVDDLMTTGATLASAAKVLLPLKPASINTLVVARVV
jgi:ComF family protein